jgi:hypothetical protein
MGFLEPLPIAAQLEVDRQRRQGVNATEAPQPGDRRPPRPVDREMRDPLSERLLASGQSVDMRDQVRVGELADRLTERLSRQPTTMFQLHVDGFGYTRP